MKNKILNIFLFCLVLISCNKNASDNFKNLTKTDIATTTNIVVSSIDDNVPAPTHIYPNISYYSGSRTLVISTDIGWSFMPTDPHFFDGYTIEYTISGHQPNSETAIRPLSSSFTTYVISNSQTTPITVTVKVELFNNLGTSIGSVSQSLKIVPVVDAGNALRDSVAMITMSNIYGNEYNIQATNLAYLDGQPNNSLYLYVFYIASLDEKNLKRNSLFLGYTKISGSSFFPAAGGFSFDLPTVSPTSIDPYEYDPSHIRVLLSQKSYPINYFTNPLANVGYITYLIDDCVNDRILYDIYCRGLNSTNKGTFSAHATTRMAFTIGSMDRMLDFQIYIDRARGFLQ